MDKGRYREELRALEESCKPIDEAIANQSATSEDAFPSAIKWTGKNLREVIDLTGWNESASSKWTWAEYEQVVEEKGLKIFTPSGSVMADIGDWIIYNGKDCYVTAQKTKSATSEEVAEAIGYVESVKGYLNDVADHQDPKTYNSLDLAITALQAYQPTISKTETTSWTMIDSDINLWECSKCNEEWNFEFGGPDENNMHYCPNCGRRLEKTT